MTGFPGGPTRTASAVEHPGYWAQMSHADTLHAANGWGSAESQQSRFDAWWEHVLPAVDEPILDYGCGTGELGAWLQSAASVHEPAADARFAYQGVDRSLPMIERGRMEHPGLALQVLDGVARVPAGRFAHIAAVGVFNLAPYTLEDVASWMLAAMQRATKTVALSIRTEPAEGHLSLDPAQLTHLAGSPRRPFVLDTSYRRADALLVAYMDR